MPPSPPNSAPTGGLPQIRPAFFYPPPWSETAGSRPPEGQGGDAGSSRGSASQPAIVFPLLGGRRFRRCHQSIRGGVLARYCDLSLFVLPLAQGPSPSSAGPREGRTEIPQPGRGGASPVRAKEMRPRPPPRWTAGVGHPRQGRRRGRRATKRNKYPRSPIPVKVPGPIGALARRRRRVRGVALIICHCLAFFE
jgi:hypothetical protein